MRKDNRARYTQRIAKATKNGKVIPAKTITHNRSQRPSPALIEDPNAAWVHWKDTDAARRRGWSKYGK